MTHKVQEKAYYLGVSAGEKKKRQTGEEYIPYTLMLMTENGADNISIDSAFIEIFRPESISPMAPIIVTYAVDNTKTYPSGIMKVINIVPAEGMDYTGKPVQRVQAVAKDNKG